MRNIDKARRIRDVILSEQDQVERASAVVAGAEHPCWQISGERWHACVSNIWDMHLALCRSDGACPRKREDLISFELLEVYSDGAAVLTFVYEIGGAFELLLKIVDGCWQETFMRGLQATARLPMKQAA